MWEKKNKCVRIVRNESKLKWIRCVNRWGFHGVKKSPVLDHRLNLSQESSAKCVEDCVCLPLYGRWHDRGFVSDYGKAEAIRELKPTRWTPTFFCPRFTKSIGIARPEPSQALSRLVLEMKMKKNIKKKKPRIIQRVKATAVICSRNSNVSFLNASKTMYGKERVTFVRKLCENLFFKFITSFSSVHHSLHT